MTQPDQDSEFFDSQTLISVVWADIESLSVTVHLRVAFYFAVQLASVTSAEVDCRIAS